MCLVVREHVNELKTAICWSDWLCDPRYVEFPTALLGSAARMVLHIVYKVHA